MCNGVYYSVWLILVVDTYIPILLVRSSWALELNYSPDNPFRLRVSNAKSKQRQETLVFLTLYVEYASMFYLATCIFHKLDNSIIPISGILSFTVFSPKLRLRSLQ